VIGRKTVRARTTANTLPATTMKLNVGLITDAQSHVNAAPRADSPAISPAKAGLRMLFQANAAAVWMPCHAACTAFRNVSERWYAMYSAAPSATIAVMTRTIGLAFMTALNAICAIVAPRCTAVQARIAPR
jgi:hypothetical protein